MKILKILFALSMSLLIIGGFLVTLVTTAPLLLIVITGLISYSFSKRVLDFIYRDRRRAALVLMRGITLWAIPILGPPIIFIALAGFKAWLIYAGSKFLVFVGAGAVTFTIGGTVKYLSVVLPRLIQTLMRVRAILATLILWTSWCIPNFIKVIIKFLIRQIINLKNGFVKIQTYLFGDAFLAATFRYQLRYPANSAG